MAGDLTWEASTHSLTTEDFYLGAWMANGCGFLLGQNAGLASGAYLAGDGLHGEARLAAGPALLKLTHTQGLEFWRSDAGQLWLGLGLDGKIRLGQTQPAMLLGSVVRVLEVFDGDGLSLGYVPIYAGG